MINILYLMISNISTKNLKIMNPINEIMHLKSFKSELRHGKTGCNANQRRTDHTRNKALLDHQGASRDNRRQAAGSNPAAHAPIKGDPP